MKLHNLIITIMAVSFTFKTYCQVFEAESGNVVYSGVVGGEAQYIEQAYAYLCNEFVSKDHKGEKLPKI